MCSKGSNWDDPLPDELKPRWENWLKDLQKLQDVKVERCLKPKDIGEIQTAELHHFSDASSQGYGQCSYIRLIGQNGVHCALLMAKARVAPLKVVTIPRLELTAAVVSASISASLQKELDLNIDKEYFWTD